MKEVISATQIWGMTAFSEVPNKVLILGRVDELSQARTLLGQRIAIRAWFSAVDLSNPF
jgi:hypothetical protein